MGFLRVVLLLTRLQLLFFLASGFEVSNSTNGSVTVTCERLHNYDDLDVVQVLGSWKVTEIYMHILDEGVTELRSCPIVQIWLPEEFPSSTFGPPENQLYHVQHINAKFRKENRHLRLLWDEGGHTIEYALYFRNDSAGYWHVYDGQNGTMTTRPTYNQFQGTIQVLKAVNDHLLLNFCQEGNMGRSPQLYSVLFSRNPGEMSRWEMESVHSLLQNKRLSVASRRMVCGNSGAERPMHAVMLSVLTCMFAYILGTW